MAKTSRVSGANDTATSSKRAEGGWVPQAQVIEHCGCKMTIMPLHGKRGNTFGSQAEADARAFEMGRVRINETGKGRGR